MGFNCLITIEPLRGDNFLFIIQFPGFQLVLNWSPLEGWKVELTLEPPSGFESRSPGLGIHCFKHLAIACFSFPQWDVEIISTCLAVKCEYKVLKVYCVARLQLQKSTSLKFHHPHRPWKAFLFLQIIGFVDWHSQL